MYPLPSVIITTSETLSISLPMIIFLSPHKRYIYAFPSFLYAFKTYIFIIIILHAFMLLLRILTFIYFVGFVRSIHIDKCSYS